MGDIFQTIYVNLDYQIDGSNPRLISVGNINTKKNNIDVGNVVAIYPDTGYIGTGSYDPPDHLGMPNIGPISTTYIVNNTVYTIIQVDKDNIYIAGEFTEYKRSTLATPYTVNYILKMNHKGIIDTRFTDLKKRIL